MRLITAALLLLALAACASAPEAIYQGGAPQIDVPEGPFPYNSRFCT